MLTLPSADAGPANRDGLFLALVLETPAIQTIGERSSERPAADLPGHHAVRVRARWRDLHHRVRVAVERGVRRHDPPGHRARGRRHQQARWRSVTPPDA